MLTDMGNNLENNMKSIEILNDLIEISNDRVKKAIKKQSQNYGKKMKT